jgi:hypothetical protein
MSAARPLRRNRNTTNMTSPTASTSAFSTSRSEARMVGERSDTTFKSMAGGMLACKCGSKARTLSTDSMMLAPGALYSINRMAGFAIGHAVIAHILNRIDPLPPHLTSEQRYRFYT